MSKSIDLTVRDALAELDWQLSNRYEELMEEIPDASPERLREITREIDDLIELTKLSADEIRQRASVANRMYTREGWKHLRVGGLLLLVPILAKKVFEWMIPYRVDPIVYGQVHSDALIEKEWKRIESFAKTLLVKGKDLLFAVAKRLRKGGVLTAAQLEKMQERQQELRRMAADPSPWIESFTLTMIPTLRRRKVSKPSQSLTVHSQQPIRNKLKYEFRK